MPVRRWISPALLLAGTALVIDAVVRGTANLALVIVIPVVTGNSAEFLVGVVLLVLGLFLLPLAFERGDLEAENSPSPPEETGSTSIGGGGLVLVGPVPVFFGTWKNPPRRVYWIAVGLGTAALLAGVLLVLWH